MLNKDIIYYSFVKATEALGKGEKFTILESLSRTEFDLIVKIAANCIINECENCELRKK